LGAGGWTGTTGSVGGGGGGVVVVVVVVVVGAGVVVVVDSGEVLGLVPESVLPHAVSAARRTAASSARFMLVTRHAMLSR
jgi:hypothetical protein